MLWKKNSKNSGNLTRHPQSASKLRINSLLKGLFTLVAIKVIVLGSMFLPRAELEQAEQEPVFESITTVGEAGGSGPSYVLRAEQTLRPESTFLAPAAGSFASLEPVPQSASAAPVEEARLAASSLLGPGVAHAQNLPVPNTSGLSGLSSPNQSLDGGELPVPAIPVPEVGGFVSRDSAAAKQAELNRREQELMALQQQMESRLTELHTLENRLQGMIDSASSTQESQLASLVDMYANMKPRVAAEALSTMDPALAVKILTGLKSTESGEIMSYMDPLVAAGLSEAMTEMQL